MSFWQTIKSKFSKKQELPQVPTMESINQQNADLTQKEQSVETLLNMPPAPLPEESQVMPAPEAQVTAEPAPIVPAPAKKAAPKKTAKKVAKNVVKKFAPKKVAKKAAPKKVAPKKAVKKTVKKAAPKKKR